MKRRNDGGRGGKGNMRRGKENRRGKGWRGGRGVGDRMKKKRDEEGRM